jgi:hypothetical protein
MRDFESDCGEPTAGCGCGKLRRPTEIPVINADVYDKRLSQHTVPPDVWHQKPNVMLHVCPLLYPLSSVRTCVIVPLSIKEMCRYVANGLLLHLFY